MSSLVSCKGLHQSFSGKVLFESLDLTIGEGDRLGLIGANGNGKTTLMQIMVGSFQPDEGEISVRKGLKLAYIAQSPDFGDARTAMNAVVDNLLNYGVDPLDASVRAAAALSKAGFDQQEQEIRALSGGWLKRLQIAGALALEADLLMLDEPTNHLDLKGVLWLEEILRNASFAWVMVSHDRYFLDRTVNRVAELDHSFPGGVFVSAGNYTDHVAKRQDFLDSQLAYADSLKSKVRREDAWLARGPKARTTKAQGRIDQAMRLKDELAEVKSRLKTGKVEVDFASSGRKTKKLIAAEGISKAWPSQSGSRLIVKNLDVTLRPGDRLGLLGDNGSGKTTLLKILAGEAPPDEGQVQQALDLQVVYFDQHREELDPTWTLKRALCDAGDSVVYQGRSLHIVSWASRFRFRAEQLDVPVAELSGGEQARVVIARLMLRPADVLVLDEPTNDLDIPTLETLEDSLQEFQGAVILVSHDRFFLKTLCTSFIALDGKGGAISYGSYEQWQNDLAKVTAAPKPKAGKTEVAVSKPKATNKKLSYMDQREYDGMEEAIMIAETTLQDWQSKVDDPAMATQAVKLQEAYKELEKAQAEVDRLYARWAELEGKLE